MAVITRKNLSELTDDLNSAMTVVTQLQQIESDCRKHLQEQLALAATNITLTLQSYRDRITKPITDAQKKVDVATFAAAAFEGVGNSREETLKSLGEFVKSTENK